MFDLNDFVIAATPKKTRKKYKCYCDSCGKDRGYINRDKNVSHCCYDCGISNRNKVFDFVGTDAERITKNGVTRYRANCISCGKDRGFVLKLEINKTCISCSRRKTAAIKRSQEDPLRKIQRVLRKRLSVSIYVRLKNRGTSKRYNSIMNFLDFSCEDLVKHLESLFQPGMSWGNYGKWHIDHKIPDSWFKYDSFDHPEFKKSWSLTNLQPKWAKENQIKGNRFSE